MRRLVLAALMAATAHSAFAADLPDYPVTPLRGGFSDGPTQIVNWQGVYVGGQVGYTSGRVNFENTTRSLTDTMLQNYGGLKNAIADWTLLGTASPTSSAFGAFIGYNAQWDDVVLGIEANYNHLSGLSGSVHDYTPKIAGSIDMTGVSGVCFAPPPGGQTTCSVNLAGTATAYLHDTLTLRGKWAWGMDNWLGYAFGGLALGALDVNRSATVNKFDQYWIPATAPATGLVPYGPMVYTSSTQNQNSRNVLAYGWTLGGGFEALLMGGLFGRVEYEYVRYTSAKDVQLNTNSVRLGMGYKF